MNYIKADPQGNITAIVTDPSDPEDRIQIASGIMEKDRTVEQVAFVIAPENGSDISIEMAGGEFCGNAALSAAALYYMRKGAKKAPVWFLSPVQAEAFRFPLKEQILKNQLSEEQFPCLCRKRSLLLNSIPIWAV